MATVRRYQTAAGERWEVRYRQPNGATSRKRGVTTKRDASVWASKVETQGGGRLCVTSARPGRSTVIRPSPFLSSWRSKRGKWYGRGSPCVGRAETTMASVTLRRPLPRQGPRPRPPRAPPAGT